MTLQIPDENLKAAKLDERGLLTELACHLFDTDRLTLAEAARLAGMGRIEFEDALHDRSISIYRYDEEDFRNEMKAVRNRQQGT
jgi:predicted HTH domain antitoxin